MAGATVVLAGRRARTGALGGARLKLRLRGARYTMVARVAGFISARARLTAN